GHHALPQHLSFEKLDRREVLLVPSESDLRIPDVTDQMLDTGRLERSRMIRPWKRSIERDVLLDDRGAQRQCDQRHRDPALVPAVADGHAEILECLEEAQVEALERSRIRAHA